MMIDDHAQARGHAGNNAVGGNNVLRGRKQRSGEALCAEPTLKNSSGLIATPNNAYAIWVERKYSY